MNSRFYIWCQILFFYIDRIIHAKTPKFNKKDAFMIDYYNTIAPSITIESHFFG